MKGRAARMKGVWRRSFFAAMGSAFAESARLLLASIAWEVLLRAASAACLIEFEVDMNAGEESWGGEK